MKFTAKREDFSVSIGSFVRGVLFSDLESSRGGDPEDPEDPWCLRKGLSDGVPYAIRFFLSGAASGAAQGLTDQNIR